MNQYCRYCTNAVVTPENDVWCESQNRMIIEKTAKAKNNCKDYNHCKFDAYNPQQIYRPDQAKEQNNQTNLFGE